MAHKVAYFLQRQVKSEWSQVKPEEQIILLNGRKVRSYDLTAEKLEIIPQPQMYSDFFGTFRML